MEGPVAGDPRTVGTENAVAGRLARRIAVFHALAGSAWILASVPRADLPIEGAATLAWLQALRGFALVVATSLLLYALARRALRSDLKSQRSLQMEYAGLRARAADLEARLSERTAELRESNAELETFCYSVSHDLRAPLRALQGFATALLADHADRLDEEGQDYARRLAGAARRMDSLIQDLLAYSRVGRSDMQLRPVSLASIVAEALEQVKSEAKERGAEVTVDPALPTVVGHRGTLVQVSSNLLSNALKFVAPGTPPRIRVRAERSDGNVRLWVEDNGIGIAPEHQERIFRVFERLHGIEAYPGSGIGLAIVRKAVVRMGGRAGVESEAGRGSRFWIDLPGTEEAA
jgi:signal transduction histidine kinase